MSAVIVVTVDSCRTPCERDGHELVVGANRDYLRREKESSCFPIDVTVVFVARGQGYRIENQVVMVADRHVFGAAFIVWFAVSTLVAADATACFQV